MIVNFSIKMEIEDKDFDKVKQLEHHAERLLDLDHWNEIKSVYGCKVKINKEES